jgi:carboxymethylenebutenolidase
MGELITFTRPDGQTCPAYAASPQDPSAPGLVVIQEWWGLNAQIKRTGDRFAEAGFRVLVPDLYRGKLAKDGDEASHLMKGLDWGGALEDIAGALAHLEQGGGKAGVLGFCMGGALTLLSAAKVPATHAAVCFYGIPPAEAADLSTIRIPLMCHFAAQDSWCSADAIAGLEATLEAGPVPYELYMYPGTEHAFFNEARPEVYVAEAADLAFQRSVAFLKARLA